MNSIHCNPVLRYSTINKKATNTQKHKKVITIKPNNKKKGRKTKIKKVHYLHNFLFKLMEAPSLQDRKLISQ